MTQNIQVGSSDFELFAGDYSAGTFLMLLQDPTGGSNIRGVSLVEQNTVLGDTPLQAGDFLITTGTKDVLLFDSFQAYLDKTMISYHLLIRHLH